MLSNEAFRHDLLRKYSLVFGSLFNEIELTHLDPTTGEVARTIKVPLTYAPKEKILARVLADPKIDRQAAAVLPRLSFELTSMAYDPNRKLRSVARNSLRTTDSADELFSIKNPVPYDLKYTLWVYAKYMEDHNQIIEQILPFFVPHFTATVEFLPGVLIDTHVRLDSVTTQDVYKDRFDQRRTIMSTLEFSVDGYLFGPERRQPLIKFSNVEFFTPRDDVSTSVGNTPAIDRVTAQPGLDANGDPTTNVDITIDYHDISPTDDWAYIVQIAGTLDT